MGYWGYAPYVSVAERRQKAEKAAAKAKKGGAQLSPVEAYRGAMAKTFWGKAWGDNLERYSDYANRLPRGRTYARNGSVIDLQIAAGEVSAQVMGSSLYRVRVAVAPVPEKLWQAIAADCTGSIDSLVALLQGQLSQPVMERICKPAVGLFPAPKDIKLECSCPDSATMCKHVAAALYGVGVRLDHAPELLFTLRGVNAADLVSHASAVPPQAPKRPAREKLLPDDALAEMFGIEMAHSPVQPKTRASVAVPSKSAQAPVARMRASHGAYPRRAKR